MESYKFSVTIAMDDKIKAEMGRYVENTASRVHHADYVALSICKSWHWLRRQVAVTRLV
jgi:hypothetical protein